MSYTLRFPFRLPPGQNIGDLDEPAIYSRNGLAWSIERKLDLFLFKVVGLNSEEHCHQYAKRIWSGLNWLLLKTGVAPIVSLKFDRVAYAENAEEAARNLEREWGIPYSGPIHGLANEDMLCAHPSGQNIRFCAVGSPGAVVSTPVSRVIAAVDEGIEIRAGIETIEDRKLQVALDLYAAYWLEHSDRARLLTLILALESLMTYPPRHKIVRELLDKWKPDIERCMQQLKKGTAEFTALESLDKELFFKKTDSLRRQVRSLALEAFEFLNIDNAEDRAREAVWVYDQRSTLVHEGELPPAVLRKATRIAKDIVQQVLEARFQGLLHK